MKGAFIRGDVYNTDLGMKFGVTAYTFPIIPEGDIHKVIKKYAKKDPYKWVQVCRTTTKNFTEKYFDIFGELCTVKKIVDCESCADALKEAFVNRVY